MLGASAHDPTICSAAGRTGTKYTLGTAGGMDPEDLARSRLILLWGSNPLTGGHHVWKFIQDAQRDGAYVVAIDPVRTRSAAQADEHLAPLPGTDAALALGLMNVVIGLEHFPTDTTDYAGIVLPATMQTEHLDVVAGYGNLYLVWNEPPGECLPTTETFRRLARRMGMTQPSLYDSDESLARRLLDSGHPWLAGITVETLRKQGFARLNVPKPFLPFAEGFPTTSGRLEFVSQRAARGGHDPLAGYTPPADPGDALVLISAAPHHFLNTTFGNNPELRRRAGAPRVTVHPGDAAARGIADGGRVRVHNARGSFEAVAEVSDRVRPGVAATTKGRWAKFNGGANVNATVDERDADMAGGAVFHDNRVEITPVEFLRSEKDISPIMGIGA